MSLKHTLESFKAFFVGVPIFVWQILFFYLPLAIIAVLSVTQFDDTVFYHSFTLDFYSVFINNIYLKIILQSFALALITGLLCLIIGYPVAYYIAFKARYKTVLLFLLILPFWTNFLLHVLSWFFVLDRSGVINNLLLYFNIIREPIEFLNSMFAIFVVMVYSYVPFMILPLYSTLEKFDKRLLEASLDLGATMTETIRKVLLPLTMSGIITGFSLVFVPAYAEFAIPSLMGGDRYMFVGSVIYNYILGNRTMSVGSAFTVLSVSALIFVMALVYLYSKYANTVVEYDTSKDK